MVNVHWNSTAKAPRQHLGVGSNKSPFRAKGSCFCCEYFGDQMILWNLEFGVSISHGNTGQISRGKSCSILFHWLDLPALGIQSYSQLMIESVLSPPKRMVFRFHKPILRGRARIPRDTWKLTTSTPQVMPSQVTLSMGIWCLSEGWLFNDGNNQKPYGFIRDVGWSGMCVPKRSLTNSAFNLPSLKLT